MNVLFVCTANGGRLVMAGSVFAVPAAKDVTDMLAEVAEPRPARRQRVTSPSRSAA